MAYSLRSYPHRLLVSLDRLANVTLLNGSPDETISQRAAWSSRDGKKWGCLLCKVLHIFHRDHCEDSISDRTRPPL